MPSGCIATTTAQHHTFGDVSVRATSADQGQVAVYAAQRSSDNALTIMVINKSLTQTLTSPITFSSADPITRAAVYRYSAANLNAILRQADQPIASGSFSATFPAQSITLFVTSPRQSAGQTSVSAHHSQVIAT